MSEASEENMLIVLLALDDISGGNTEAEIPTEEIQRYVNANFDDLVKRVRPSETSTRNTDGN